MLRSQYTYYIIILGEEGVKAMIIFIMQGGGSEFGKSLLCNIGMLLVWNNFLSKEIKFFMNAD